MYIRHVHYDTCSTTTLTCTIWHCTYDMYGHYGNTSMAGAVPNGEWWRSRWCCFLNRLKWTCKIHRNNNVVDGYRQHRVHRLDLSDYEAVDLLFLQSGWSSVSLPHAFQSVPTSWRRSPWPRWWWRHGGGRCPRAVGAVLALPAARPVPCLPARYGAVYACINEDSDDRNRRFFAWKCHLGRPGGYGDAVQLLPEAGEYKWCILYWKSWSLHWKWWILYNSGTYCVRLAA